MKRRGRRPLWGVRVVHKGEPDARGWRRVELEVRSPDGATATRWRVLMDADGAVRSSLRAADQDMRNRHRVAAYHRVPRLLRDAARQIEMFPKQGDS